MRHFVIYTNPHKDKDGSLAARIRTFLLSRGCEVSQVTMTDDNRAARQIPKTADCMLVLGGDGTMLQASCDIKQRQIPLIGVNLGTLGYMTEIEPAVLEKSLELLIRDEYEVESRMMLSGSVLCKTDGADTQTVIAQDTALNDIVISRSGPLQIITFNIFVNGQFLNQYSADGVIITTPTGSTGYNLSAGGPIVEPKARLMMVTPICPHTLNQRSIILAAEDEIEVTIPEGRNGKQQQVEVSFDGNHAMVLRTGDRVRIRQSEKTTDIIKLSRVSFLEILHKKMSES